MTIQKWSTTLLSSISVTNIGVLKLGVEFSFLLSLSPTPPPDEMQPPPGYENKDEKLNRYKESKIIITRDEALDALRTVLKASLPLLFLRSAPSRTVPGLTQR